MLKFTDYAVFIGSDSEIILCIFNIFSSVCKGNDFLFCIFRIIFKLVTSFNKLFGFRQRGCGKGSA